MNCGGLLARVVVDILRTASLEEIALDVAYAELASPRNAKYYLPAFSPGRGRELGQLPLESWTERDRDQGRTAALRLRGGVLYPLSIRGIERSLGKVRVHELSSVRLMAIPQFLSFAPTRRLDEFVKRLDAGVDLTGDDFAQSYRRTRGAFVPDLMRGHPILVAERVEGPYVEAEGLTRMSCLLSKYLAGEAVPEAIETYLGVGPAVASWQLYAPPV